LYRREEREVMSETEACLHCERAAAVNGLGLCPGCDGVRGIRRLYERRRGWTPAWEEHLRKLTARARQQLPLFEEREG
jgi:hypothetical protein